MRGYLHEQKETQHSGAKKHPSMAPKARNLEYTPTAQKIGLSFPGGSVGLSIFQAVQLVLINSRHYLLLLGLSERGPQYSLLFNRLMGKGFGESSQFQGLFFFFGVYFMSL